MLIMAPSESIKMSSPTPKSACVEIPPITFNAPVVLSEVAVVSVILIAPDGLKEVAVNAPTLAEPNTFNLNPSSAAKVLSLI